MLTNHEREEMLNEMKRTTRENGGKPLGKTRFTDETGIKEYDWGKYWEKFSDFVMEAGFTPNKPWTKYPEGVLEEKMILLIRNQKLSKYPTLAALRVAKTNDPDFPFRAVKRRWSDFVRDLVLYCERNPGHDDILQMCRPLLQKSDEKERENVTDNLSSNVGEVYLYKRGKYYKIGCSKDPVRRGKEIRLESPDTLKFIHSFMTDDPRGLEAYWKKRFEDKQYKDTEFFSLNYQDIKSFKRWKKLY